MWRSLSVLGAGALLLLGAAPAGAVELSNDYMTGRWTTGSADACGKPDSEITEFRADGTFTTSRDGDAAAVGFWTLTDDQLELQALTHDRLNAALEAIPGDFGHFVVRALVFDVADTTHRMVMSIGDTLQGSTVVRCP
jgi:hypothetical protein